MERFTQTRERPVDLNSGSGDTIIEGLASVLLVTSDTGLIEAVRNALQNSSGPRFGVVPAKDPDAAERRMQQNGIDAVILDADAVDLLSTDEFAKAVERLGILPAVVLVDERNRQLGGVAVRSGAFAYVIKGELADGLLPSTVDSAIQHHRQQHCSRENEERLSLALCGAEHGLWDWDLGSDRIFYSSRWNHMLGLPDADFDGGIEHWFSRVHQDDMASLKRAIQGHLAGKRAHLESEFRVRCADGTYRWMMAQGMSACDKQGRPRRLAGCLSDIDERKTTEQQILHDAMHDSLTGLPNRMVFLDRVSLAMARQRRHPEAHFAVLFLDLDHFKLINDTFGHAIGDEVLVTIASRLEKLLRPEDTVCRLCGDEFAVLLSEVGDGSVTMQVAERLREVLSEPMMIKGHELRAGVSAGVAISTTGYVDPHEILHDADVAMYRAKAAGGSGCQLFDPEMHQSAVALFAFETELRRAVANRDFVVHYQPIVDIESAKIVGFEGLVRWNHPDEGLLPAAQFLAVAEATGLVVPMGWWVLEQCCRQMSTWHERFPAEQPLWIAVNISGKLFHQADMVSRLQAILEATGLEASSLRIELSESIVSKQGDEAVARLQELRALGVRLSVDDFGSDFSSLALVDRFRFDSLKIDPGCLAGVESGDESLALLRTILAVAKTLEMGVVAEGVETSSQAECLRQRKCPQAQGFWFSKPVAPEAAEALLLAT